MGSSTIQQLEDSARLAAIVESSDDAIISKTLEGTITSWNSGAEALFGYTADEMIGQSIMRLIPRDAQHEEVDILARIRRGERIRHYETRRVSKRGNLIEISLTISPLRDASGTIVGASKIARDISALKAHSAERERLLESERAARREAERLGHLKDEFLATLSHELRTPLNAMLGWCALLKQASFREVNREQAVDTIERNARAQAKIIDDLLDMSRIVSGKIELALTGLPLDAALRTAIHAIRPTATAKRVQIRQHIDSDAAIVSGDAPRVQQILWNLLTNAVKFTPADGIIDVSLKVEAGRAIVTVADTGIGIDPEFVPYIFERFRQAEGGSGRRFGGLGLGLSIVRNLVELHGGTIAARSAGPNQGSTFTMQLPLRDPALLAQDALERNSASASEAANGLPRLDRRRLLVVDDDADSRTLLARVLSERGAEVFEAANANAALEVLAGHRIDALLSDLGMPGVDGYQFIQLVRKLDSSRAAVPAIAVSAYARPEDRNRAVAAGYQRHVAKPYSIPSILGAVVEVLPP